MARLLLWLGVVLCALPAAAGSLGIHPLRVDLSAARPTAAITLNNTGGTAMVVQLQLMKWTASGEDDHYEASADVLVTPPIFTIAPGVAQIVRLGLSSDINAEDETAYRLFIEEVPPPSKPGYQGLRVALRLGLPVFVAPAQEARPRIEWTASKASARLITLRARNDGNAHARILTLALRAPGENRNLAAQTTARYLLPGQTRQWQIPLDKPWQGRQVHLSVTTDQGVSDVNLALQSP